jgi:hypothetical protein
MKVAAASALSVGLTGCLAAQDYDLQDPIVSVNRSPVIRRTLANDKPDSVLEECPVWFEALVDDPDVDDRLEFRWFVTALPGDKRELVSAGYLRNTAQSLRQPERTERSDWSSTFKWQDAGKYLVQFMATDGSLPANAGPGSTPQPDLIPGADGGLVPNPRYETHYNWYVDLKAGTCPN